MLYVIWSYRFDATCKLLAYFYSGFIQHKYSWSINRQTSNIRRTLVGSQIVDHSVGACPNYILILHFTHGFNELGKDNCKTGRETSMSWWRHQMETFSALLALCAGNSLVTGEFPAQRPVTRSVDGFFDLRLNKRLSKQSQVWWFETPSRPLWRHCNVLGSDAVYIRYKTVVIEASRYQKHINLASRN